LGALQAGEFARRVAFVRRAEQTVERRAKAVEFVTEQFSGLHLKSGVGLGPRRLCAAQIAAFEGILHKCVFI